MEMMCVQNVKEIVKLVQDLLTFVLVVNLLNLELDKIVIVLKDIMRMEVMFVNHVLVTVSIVLLLKYVLNVMLIPIDLFLTVIVNQEHLILHSELEEELLHVKIVQNYVELVLHLMHATLVGIL